MSDGDGGALTEDAGADGSVGPMTLASGQDEPWNIALDQDNVYWQSIHGARSVDRVPKSGGASPVSVVATATSDFAIANGIIWFISSAGLEGVSLSGPSPGVLVPGATGNHVAVLSDRVYWVGPVPTAEFSLKYVSTAGGTPTEVPLPAAFPGLQGGTVQLVAGPDAMYVTVRLYGVLRVAMDDSWTLIPFQDHASGFINRLAVDNGSIYATTTSAVRVAPSGGGSWTTLASGFRNLAGITVDDTYVYTTDERDHVDGRIVRIPKAGGGATVLADQQAAPIDIAVDDKALYWITVEDGTVRKLLK